MRFVDPQKIKTLVRLIDQDRLEQMAGKLSAIERLPAGAGFARATDVLEKSLTGSRLLIETHEAPSGDGFRAFGRVTPLSWECRTARLTVVDSRGSERVLADYAESPFSVIPGSTLGDETQWETEIVTPGDGPQGTSAGEIKGRLALTAGRGALEYRRLIADGGALGIILDGATGAEGPLPQDALRPGSFPAGALSPLVGFALTGKRGRWLRRELAAAGGSLRAKVVLKADTAPGRLRTLSVTLKGRTEKCILLTCDLSGRAGSAGSSAAPAALLHEVVLALAEAIAEKAIPVPYLSLRLLFTAGEAGLPTYFAVNPPLKKRVLAALEIDRAGIDQGAVPGGMVVERPPLSLPGFSTLLETALGHAEHALSAPTAHDASRPFRFTMHEFGGSGAAGFLNSACAAVPALRLTHLGDGLKGTSEDRLRLIDGYTLARQTAAALFWTAELTHGGIEKLTGLKNELLDELDGSLHRVSAPLDSRSPSGRAAAVRSLGRSLLYAGFLADCTSRRLAQLPEFAPMAANLRRGLSQTLSGEAGQVLARHRGRLISDFGIHAWPKLAAKLRKKHEADFDPLKLGLERLSGNPADPDSAISLTWENAVREKFLRLNEAGLVFSPSRELDPGGALSDAEGWTIEELELLGRVAPHLKPALALSCFDGRLSFAAALEILASIAEVKENDLIGLVRALIRRGLLSPQRRMR